MQQCYFMETVYVTKKKVTIKTPLPAISYACKETDKMVINSYICDDFYHPHQTVENSINDIIILVDVILEV